MITLTQNATPPSRGLLVSVTLHIVGVVLLCQFGKAVLTVPLHHSAGALIFVPPSEAPRGPALPKPKVRTFRMPKLAAREPAQSAPRPALIEAPVLEAPPQMPPPKLAVQTPQVAVPAPPLQVKTGLLDSHDPVPAAPSRAAVTIQPSGFAAAFPQQPKLVVRAGSTSAGFDTTAPVRAAAAPSKTVSGAAGFDAQEGVARGNQPRNRVEVAAGAFGSASARVSVLSSGTQQATRAGFGDAVAAQPEATSRKVGSGTAVESTPVEITHKPKPAYTDEARRLQIQGEVVIEAVFAASGQVQVVRIVRGLGHGLNETAAAAVRAIKFRPATRQGQPVDSTATVRMNFELAY